MEICNPDWNFNLLNRVEISSRVNSKLLFKMTMQLHVNVSTRYTELKFQLGLAKPRWNFNPGWKFQIFHIIGIFSSPGWKFDNTHARIPCLFFKKTMTVTSQALFKWNDGRFIQKFHGIQKLRLKRWQIQTIWKYQKRSRRNVWR